MIFVDASAVISIVDGEEDVIALAARLTLRTCISPVVIYESVSGLARRRASSIEVAERSIDIFIEQTGAPRS